MTLNQITRYFQNEDTSIISYKKLGGNSYPTYTLCFEGGSYSDRGIYRTFPFFDHQNVTVYFDGRWLRHENSHQPRISWIDELQPNISSVDIRRLMGIPESMHVPITSNATSLSRLMVFNETFLIAPSIYRSILTGEGARSLYIVNPSIQEPELE